MSNSAIKDLRPYRLDADPIWIMTGAQVAQQIRPLTNNALTGLIKQSRLQKRTISIYPEKIFDIRLINRLTRPVCHIV